MYPLRLIFQPSNSLVTVLPRQLWLNIRTFPCPIHNSSCTRSCSLIKVVSREFSIWRDRVCRSAAESFPRSSLISLTVYPRPRFGSTTERLVCCFGCMCSPS